MPRSNDMVAISSTEPRAEVGAVRAGVFLERESDAHVELRARFLSRPPPGQVALAQPADQSLLGGLSADQFARLSDDGMLCLQLSKPMKTIDFVSFGKALGQPMVEDDQSVAEFVEHGVVLNLISRYEATDAPSLQPFSVGSLTLHTESSRRPAHLQPRYVVLMCCAAGARNAASRTLLVSMDDVLGGLARDDRLVLSQTAYQHAQSPPLLRSLGGREIFSFRDFGSSPLPWSTSAPALAGCVNGVIGKLLEGLYSARPICVAWRRGMLLVIDNHRFFHGKEAARGVSARPRRLKRLRVLEGGFLP